MSLSPKEIEEIEAVIRLVEDGLMANYYPGACSAIAVRLRALIPQPDSLEEAVEDALTACYQSSGLVRVLGKTSDGFIDVDRLRAALARRRKEQGK